MRRNEATWTVPVRQTASPCGWLNLAENNGMAGNFYPDSENLIVGCRESHFRFLGHRNGVSALFKMVVSDCYLRSIESFSARVVAKVMRTRAMLRRPCSKCDKPTILTRIEHLFRITFMSVS